MERCKKRWFIVRDKAYCYRKLWRKPITIHKLGKGDVSLTFSKGIEVRQIIVALLFFIILLQFRNVINGFLPSAFTASVYILIPSFLSIWICKQNVNGKRLDRFFLGYFRYLYNRRFSYSSGKAVYKRQMQEKQSYSGFKGVGQ